MNTQPEALRLADELDGIVEDGADPDLIYEAAAELRRLHGLDFALRNCELALKNMATKYMNAVDQRDALLEALKAIVAMWDHHCDAHGDGVPSPLHVKARAAIALCEGPVAAVEGEKK